MSIPTPSQIHDALHAETQHLPIILFEEKWRPGQLLIRITNRKHQSVYYIKSVKLIGNELCYRLGDGRKPYVLFFDSYIETSRITEQDWIIEHVRSAS